MYAGILNTVYHKRVNIYPQNERMNMRKIECAEKGNLLVCNSH